MKQLHAEGKLVKNDAAKKKDVFKKRKNGLQKILTLKECLEKPMQMK